MASTRVTCNLRRTTSAGHTPGLLRPPAAGKPGVPRRRPPPRPSYANSRPPLRSAAPGAPSRSARPAHLRQQPLSPARLQPSRSSPTSTWHAARCGAAPDGPMCRGPPRTQHCRARRRATARFPSSAGVVPSLPHHRPRDGVRGPQTWWRAEAGSVRAGRAAPRDNGRRSPTEAARRFRPLPPRGAYLCNKQG